MYELVFDRGRLTGEHDRSARMEELREKLSSRSLQPGSKASEEEIKRWVEQCFSLDYKGVYF